MSADRNRQIIVAWTVWGAGLILLERAYRNRRKPRWAGPLLPIN